MIRTADAYRAGLSDGRRVFYRGEAVKDVVADSELPRSAADLAGGEDWDNPEIRPVLEKYFAAVVPAEERLRVIHLISNLTARDFGGYQAVLATHAEGSLEAEKLQLLRSFDAGPASDYARRLAHI